MTGQADLARPDTMLSIFTRKWLSLRNARWFDAAVAVLVGLFSVGVAMWAMGVRPSSLGIPWGQGDLVPVYSYAENLRRGHWFLTNPDLGYPGFQDHGHFPVTDLFSIAQLAVLAHLTPSAIAAVNVFILGTFLTVAVATYLVLRWEAVAMPFAAAIAIAFAVLPWHFVRATSHVFLASYMSVPLALFLVGLLASRRLQRTSSRWLFPTAIAVAVIVGTNGIYFALMATVLMAVVLIVSALWPKRSWPGWRAVVVAAVVPLSAFGAVLLNRVSISTVSTGESVVRSPESSYLYGGNMATLFFPSVTTRSGRVLDRALNLGFPNNGTFEGDALLSSAGVLAILLTCVVIALRWSTRSAVDPRDALGRASFWPGLFLLTMAFFTIGGLGALFSFWISNDIRAWGRFSVFVVGIAFLVTGLVLTSWRQSRRRMLRIGSVVLGVLIVVSAVVDLSAGVQRLPIASDRAQSDELETYVGAVEDHIADDCAILELPLSPYPETAPVNRMADYSHLWTYIYSDDLRWSYGAMKGTALGDWGMDVQNDPAALLTRARAAGFCGIQVDTWAFATLADAVDDQLAFGDPDVVSSSGRWAFFDLTGPLADEFAVAPEAGFSVAVQAASLPVTWWMVDDAAALRVEGTPESTVHVDLAVSSPPCGPVVALIGGSRVTITGTQHVSVVVELDQNGRGSIPITAESQPCTIDGESSPVRLGLAGQQWAPTATLSQP